MREPQKTQGSVRAVRHRRREWHDPVPTKCGSGQSEGERQSAAVSGWGRGGEGLLSGTRVPLG